MGKSGVHNHLNTQRKRGYVLNDGDTYRLGLMFLELGGHNRKSIEVYQVAESEVKSLVTETDELANLLVEQQGMGVYLMRDKGGDAVDLDTYAGHQGYLYTTTLGKTILANCSEDHVETIIDRHGFERMTSQALALAKSISMHSLSLQSHDCDALSTI